MDGESYLRFILALVLVLGLLALAAFLLRRSGIGPKLSRSRRLATVENLPLGPRHRLLLVRRDNVEHLLLLGPQGDLLVEGDIPVAAAGTTTVSPGSTHSYAANRENSENNREPSLTRLATAIDGRADQRPFAAILEDRAPTPTGQTPSRDQPFNGQD
ncbi:MAG TPA: flagellar biosynthetic protein FliO [Dongiaceae bacterium]